MQYIHCLIGNCSRLGEALTYKEISSKNVIKALELWVQKHNMMKMSYKDRASYYTSKELHN